MFKRRTLHILNMIKENKGQKLGTNSNFAGIDHESVVNDKPSTSTAISEISEMEVSPNDNFNIETRPIWSSDDVIIKNLTETPIST